MTVLAGKFSHKPDTFVHFYTADLELFRFAWGSRREDIWHGSCVLVHAPSYWDDYRPQNEPGEVAFYEALREAYEQFHVYHVFFVYWPETK